MNLKVQKLFEKDILNIRNKKLAAQISSVIGHLEASKNISEIKNLKKLSAKGNYYRIRIGDYRMGIKIEKDEITLLRFMHRKDIYKYFP
jgi:mRNA interferase RelE/StbE